MTDAGIPIAHMFTLVLEGLADDRYDYIGPFGRRVFGKVTGGHFSGTRICGKVLALHATDYGRASADGSIRALEAEIGLQTGDGSVILMQYRGRMSPRYGPGRSRIQALFDVEDGSHRWLNGVQAIGYGEDRADGSTVMEIYALTGAAEIEGGVPLAPVDPAARTTAPAEFLLRRRSAHDAGATRHTVMSPFGARYFTLAESGGVFEGPHISGEFLSGYSWSPHHMHASGQYGQPEFEMRMHYNVKTLLRADDGTPILMSYTGATSGAYARGSWMTATQFEAPDGPHAWLNELQAVGVGRWAGDGAEYKVYALI